MHINWAVNLLPATLSTVTQLFISQFLITFSFEYVNQRIENPSENEWIAKAEEEKTNIKHNFTYDMELFEMFGKNELSESEMNSLLFEAMHECFDLVHMCDVICITLWCDDRQSFVTDWMLLRTYTHSFLFLLFSAFQLNKFSLLIEENINFVCTQSVLCLYTKRIYLFTHSIYCSLQCVHVSVCVCA